jgi:hypothetical protein
MVYLLYNTHKQAEYGTRQLTTRCIVHYLKGNDHGKTPYP